MKYVYFFLLRVIILIMATSMSQAQQNQTPVKIRIHENGNVEVSNMEDNQKKVDQGNLQSFQKPLSKAQSLQQNQNILYKSIQQSQSRNSSPSTSADLPDLIYYGGDYSFSYPYLHVNVKVANVGTSTASGFKVYFYLSKDNDIDPSDDPSITYRHIDSLHPNAYIELSLERDVSWLCGTKYLGLIIDRYNSVEESNEDNNTACLAPAFYVRECLADLKLLVLNIYDYTSPEIEYEIFVENVGGRNTKNAFDNYIYLSTDKEINQSDDYWIATWTCDFVEAGGLKYSPRLKTNINNVPVGEYYLGIYIDINDAIEEDYEDNNTGCNESQKIIISESPPTHPDLIVTDVSVIDYSGPNIEFQYSIKNQGNGGTEIGFSNYIYLSTDQTISDSDYKIAEYSRGKLNAGLLSDSGPLNKSISGVPVGDYYLGVYTDGGMVISESNENNNTRYDDSPKIIIPETPSNQPDLIVANVSVTDHTGTEIAYQFSIKNQGDASTGSGFKNYIYLSIDHTITLSDYKIDEIQSNTLNKNASDNSGIIKTTISGVPAGEYYLGVYTDGAENISEFNEGNNTGYDDSPKVIVQDSKEPDEPEGNMINNWSFSDGLNDWEFATMGGGNASAAIEGGVFHAYISASGGNLWDVRIFQNKLNIVKGKTYTASFQAKAASPREIWATVGMGSEPFITYNSDWIFNLTTEWQTYTYTFTMDYDSNPNALMTFNLGVSNADVYLDNISLVEEAEQPEEPEGNMIDNWSFSGSLNDWEFATMGGGNASAAIEGGVFHAHISAGGGNLWDVRIFQDELNIVSGNTYTAFFQAKAASPREIWATVGMGSEPFITYNSDWIFNLTTGWQTYTYTFTMDYDSNPNALMTFNLGVSNADVYLDNISLVEILPTNIYSEIQTPIIKTFDVFQNYPNPFNPITTIRFQVPEPCFVSLKVYNLLGEEVTTLVNEDKLPGIYSIDWNDKNYTAGIYLYCLKAGEFTKTRKMVLQK